MASETTPKQYIFNDQQKANEAAEHKRHDFVNAFHVVCYGYLKENRGI